MKDIFHISFGESAIPQNIIHFLQVTDIIHFVWDRGITETAVEITSERRMAGITGQLADMINMIGQRIQRDLSP